MISKEMAVLKQTRNPLNKKNLHNIIKNEFNYISSLFEVLNMTPQNSRRIASEDEGDEEDLVISSAPKKKIINKNASKKSGAQIKSKSFPQTIDGLEKELEEMKGTPMSYQKKLRKKGLQSRLNKKKRKEEIKQQKAMLKQLKKERDNTNTPFKLIKPVLNSDGDVVSNKFDFADSEIKKENKRKLSITNDSVHLENDENKTKVFSESSEDLKSNVKFKIEDVKINTKKNQQKTYDSDKSLRFDVNEQEIKSNESKNNKEPTLKNKQGPIFNKENKMVFSKVCVSENERRSKKRDGKDPTKMLTKLKETSKKIADIKKINEEKADSLLEKQKWMSALKRASGEKVRDDPELLKKTIAKEKSKKLQSKKKWQARLDKVQKDKDDRQKKRSENIKARKNEKKKRKMKKAIKKGSFVQL